MKNYIGNLRKSILVFYEKSISVFYEIYIYTNPRVWYFMKYIFIQTLGCGIL